MEEVTEAQRGAVTVQGYKQVLIEMGLLLGPCPASQL